MRTCDMSVLDGVVQQPSDERLAVEPELRKDACDLDGVDNVRLAGPTPLPLVCARGKVEGSVADE